jgi:hypothetical protein
MILADGRLEFTESCPMPRMIRGCLGQFEPVEPEPGDWALRFSDVLEEDLIGSLSWHDLTLRLTQEDEHARTTYILRECVIDEKNANMDVEQSWFGRYNGRPEKVVHQKDPEQTASLRASEWAKLLTFKPDFVGPEEIERRQIAAKVRTQLDNPRPRPTIE